VQGRKLSDGLDKWNRRYDLTVGAARCRVTVQIRNDAAPAVDRGNPSLFLAVSRLSPRRLPAVLSSNYFSAAITSGGAWTSSISTPAPPIGESALPFGWIKQTS